MEVPDFPVVVLYGTDTVLNCTFSGAKNFNLSELSIFWQLADTQRSVHAYFDKQDRLIDQDERFANRTSLFPAELTTGNASLLLRRVRVADEGTYTCFVKVDTYSKDSMSMQVAGDSRFSRQSKINKKEVFIINKYRFLLEGSKRFCTFRSAWVYCSLRVLFLSDTGGT